MIYRQHFDLPGESQTPGSVSNVRECFSHSQADRKVQHFYANESLLKVDCPSIRITCK